MYLTFLNNVHNNVDSIKRERQKKVWINFQTQWASKQQRDKIKIYWADNTTCYTSVEQKCLYICMFAISITKSRRAEGKWALGGRFFTSTWLSFVSRLKVFLSNTYDDDDDIVYDVLNVNVKLYFKKKCLNLVSFRLAWIFFFPL